MAFDIDGRDYEVRIRQNGACSTPRDFIIQFRLILWQWKIIITYLFIYCMCAGTVCNEMATHSVVYSRFDKAVSYFPCLLFLHRKDEWVCLSAR